MQVGSIVEMGGDDRASKCMGMWEWYEEMASEAGCRIERDGPAGMAFWV
jgi:hypothetical protein